ncbi:plasmid mobilization protein, partial [Porphyromonas sp.]
IIEDESTEEYYRKLSSITALIQKIGILYNQTVKAINSYHSVKAAQILLQRLEQYSQQIITIEQQAISLTLDYRKR